jgi:hypothetical protein
LIGPEDDFIFDQDIVQQETASVEQTRNRRPLLIAIPLLLLVLAIVLIIAIINPFGTQTPVATGTTVVQQALPTITISAPENGADSALLPVTAASETVSTAIEAALSEYEVVDGTVGILATELGATLIAGVCSSDSAAIADTLDAAMDAIATISDSAGGEVDALGIALIDCADESRVMRVIAVPDDAAVAFNAGDLDARGYQAQWQPVA